MKRSAIPQVLFPLGTIVSLVAVASFLGIVITREAAPISLFESVKVGMTVHEVTAILGHAQLATSSDGGLSLNYGGFRRGMWCTMHVMFDSEGKTISKFHDH